MSPAPVLRATGGAAAAAAAWGMEGLSLEILDPGRLSAPRPGVMEPVLTAPCDVEQVRALADWILPVVVSESPGLSSCVPGLHLSAAGPMDRSLLDELAARPPGRLRPSARELESESAGLALPMILHNFGNRLVGLVGNLELAAIYPAGSEKSSLKIEAARASAGEVKGYLERLSALGSPGRSRPGSSGGPFGAALETAGLIRGRAVTLESGPGGTAESDSAYPSGAVSAAVAIVTAALLRLGGAGSLTVGRCAASGILVSWERPDTEVPSLPGLALVPSLLIGATAVAAREGFRIAVNALGDLGGSISCLWGE